MDKIHSLKLSTIRKAPENRPSWKKTKHLPNHPCFQGFTACQFQGRYLSLTRRQRLPNGCHGFEVKALGGCRAFSVDYPKPPESPFPAALENATWWSSWWIRMWQLVVFQSLKWLQLLCCFKQEDVFDIAYFFVRCIFTSHPVPAIMDFKKVTYSSGCPKCAGTLVLSSGWISMNIHEYPYISCWFLFSTEDASSDELTGTDLHPSCFGEWGSRGLGLVVGTGHSSQGATCFVSCGGEKGRWNKRKKERMLIRW